MLGCGAGSGAAGFPDTAHTVQDLAAESSAPLTVVWKHVVASCFPVTVNSIDSFVWD